MPFFARLRRPSAARATRARSRRMRIEALDARTMMAILPYGAMPDDTGEFMLGDVYVNVVLVESNGSIDPNTENWTSAEVDDVEAKVNEGLDWWKQTLYEQFPQTPPGLLNFDTHFSTFGTGYEPIHRVSNDFRL